ncbi:hypothetical protein TYRP_012816 [Tyrophagus putrescentiae]|nr:hypothetical protein TYRP_012816 [Tyrophagus putrescentiae]
MVVMVSSTGAGSSSPKMTRVVSSSSSSGCGRVPVVHCAIIASTVSHIMITYIWSDVVYLT